MEVEIEDDAALPGSEVEHGSQERAMRLREAVRAAGGTNAISQRSGVPLSTLASYIRGRDMKAAGMIRLADATGVRLEWLATGEGPMRAGEAAPAPVEQPAPAARPPRLFSLVNADRLGAAYAAALQALAARGQHAAEPRRVMQVTILLYDGLTEAEENSGLAPDHPQDDPQNYPR